ncbi:aminotransferase class V-fold PLP-dependent enzyme [Shigella flexneri]
MRWQNVRLSSIRRQDSSLLAFDFAGVHHSDMVTLLAEYGIALRAGQHAPAATGRIRRNRHTARLFAPYNTKSDVDALVECRLTARWNYWWS